MAPASPLGPSRGAVAAALALGGSVGLSFGVVLPSLQRYLCAAPADGGFGASPALLSAAVSLYSVGEALGAAACGRAADAPGTTVAGVLTAALVVFVLGNLAYASAAAPWAAVAARVAVGLYTGGANTVLRTWASRVTTPAARGKLMAYLSGVSTLCLTLGPMVGALLTMVPQTGADAARGDDHAWLVVRVDPFRAPGWLLAALGVVLIPIVQCLKERHSMAGACGSKGLTVQQTSPESPQAGTGAAGMGHSTALRDHAQHSTVVTLVSDDDRRQSERTQLLKPPAPAYDDSIDGGDDAGSPGGIDAQRRQQRPSCWSPPSGKGAATALLVWLFFCNSLAFSIVETMSTLITGDQLGWSVRKTGNVMIAGGASSVVALVLFVRLSTVLEERALVAGSFAALLASVLLLADYQALVHGHDDCLAFSNTTQARCEASSSPGGHCVWLRDDCDTCSPNCRNPSYTLAPWQFVAAIVLLTGGFMLGRTAITVLFSKMLTASKSSAAAVGSMMAALVGAGSLARIGAPYIAIAAYDAARSRTFGLALGLAALFALSGAAVAGKYRHLRPG